jgi:hypothetical protein
MKLLINSIVLCLSILVTTNAYAGIEFSFLNDDPLYKEPLANIRSPDIGITLNTFKYRGQRVEFIEASLGRNIPIITTSILPGQDWDNPLLLQLGMAVGSWITLGYDDGAFPLLTQDFLISIPLSFKYGGLSAAIKYNHISAHLGDGFDKLLEEELSNKEQKDLEMAEDLLESFAGNEEIGIILKEADAYSRDFISLHAAYDYKIGIFDSRMYIHGGYAHKMVPEELGKSFYGNGFEVLYKSDIISPYYAQDITWHEDTDNTDVSMELGVIFLPKNKFIFRIAATGFIGKDRRGQLLGNKVKQFGIGLFVQ